MSTTLENLKKKAQEVSERAHAPYSQFNVGCAILTESGNVYVGCNVENNSYGLTICAERTAIASAVAAESSIIIKQVVVFTPTMKPASPCGACRQVIHEFCNEDTSIHSFCNSEETIDLTMDQLLPYAFSLKDHR